jgi:DNA-binding transcriptional ArsR family regulator
MASQPLPDLGGEVCVPRPAAPDVPAPTVAQLHAAAETFAMLATPTRLHLVWLLAQQDQDVGSLAAQVGAPVATVSQHLAKMRLAGLVSAHRHGRRQVYSVDDPHVVALADQIFRHIAPDGTLAPDPHPTTAPDRDG